MITLLLKAFTPAIVVFLLNEIGMRVFAIYELVPWMDIPFHIAGGMAIAYAALYLSTNLFRIKAAKHSKVFHFLLAVSVTALFATVWEWYEFLYDIAFQAQYQAGIADTMGDMFLGIVGAAFFALSSQFRQK